MTQPRHLDPYTSPRAFYGAELRRLREAAGLSQEQLGERIFCSGTYVGQFESATRRPQRDLSKLLDEVLGRMADARGGESGKGAADYFRAALAADAGFARAQAALCRMELWKFEANHDAAAFDQARLACLRAQNMDRTLGEVSLALGDLYRAQGKEKQALYHYDAIIDDPALRWQALAARARLHVDHGRDEAAMRDFKLALQASPGNDQLHAQLGDQQFRLGQYRAAIDSYRIAVALRPDYVYYWMTYGALLLVVGDNDAAEAALRRSLAIEPSEASLSNLGTLRYQKGDYAGAANLYRRAIELNPTDFSYPGYLGDALEAIPGNAAQARQAYTQAAALAQRYVDARPDDAKALAALGWYRAQLGDSGNAMRLVGRARALGLEPGEVAVYNAQTLAVLGRLDEARAELNAARKAGVSASRIDTHAVFRRAGLVGPPESTAPAPAKVHAPAARAPGA